jgi:hypothetical protein
MESASGAVKQSNLDFDRGPSIGPQRGNLACRQVALRMEPEPPGRGRAFPKSERHKAARAEESSSSRAEDLSFQISQVTTTASRACVFACGL